MSEPTTTYPAAPLAVTLTDCPYCGSRLKVSSRSPRHLRYCTNIFCHPWKKRSKSPTKVTLPSGKEFWVPAMVYDYPPNGQCQCLACCGCPGDATRQVSDGRGTWVCEECADAVMVAYVVGEGALSDSWGKSDPLLRRAFGPLPKAGLM